MKKVFINLVGLALVALVLGCFSCSQETRPESGRVPSSTRGLEIVVERLGKDRVRLKVTNESALVIYCGFHPGEAGVDPDSFPFVVEQKDKNTEVFKVVGEGHYAPPLNPIQPGMTIGTGSLGFPQFPHGTYRVRKAYYTDVEVVELLRRQRFSDMSREEQQRVEGNYQEAVSSEFTIE